MMGPMPSIRAMAVGIVAILAFGVIPGVFAEESEPVWTDNLDVAKSRALHSDSDLLICFTVRDWSAVCRRFEEHFLLQPDFTDRLDSSFVLVHYDLSIEEKDSAGAMLRERFEISTFPAVMLTNAHGMPYALTGFPPNSAESYAEHLILLRDENRARQQLLREAADLKGVDRAKALSQVLPDLGDHRRAKFYGDIMREVIDLDPDNASGKREMFEVELADLAYVQAMRRLDGEFQWMKMVELTNEHIEDMKLSGSRKQAALMNRFDIHRRQGDMRAMFGTLQEIVEVNPYNPHGRQASQILQSLASQLQL